MNLYCTTLLDVMLVGGGEGDVITDQGFSRLLVTPRDRCVHAPDDAPPHTHAPLDTHFLLLSRVEHELDMAGAEGGKENIMCIVL